MSAIIVTVVLGGLLAIVAVVLASGSLTSETASGALAGTPAAWPVEFDGITDAGLWYGILQSAGLLFFGFAGYARMATLGEEVVNPRRTLPRAIFSALGITLLVYGLIGVLTVTVLGPALAQSTSPLADLLGAALPGDSAPWTVAVRLIAAVACIGSLLGVLAGLSRTGLAMARERDLPGPLSRVNPRTHTPIVAEATVGLAAIAGILLLDPARLVGFSACSVLVYYAIAHLSALRQHGSDRWLPRVVQYVGLVGCLLLAVTLPWPGVLAAAAWLAVGLVARAIRLALTRL